MSHLSFSPSHWTALASPVASLAPVLSVAYWTDKWRTTGSCIQVKELGLRFIPLQARPCWWRVQSSAENDVKAERIVSHWNVRPSEVRGGWSSQLSNYFLCYVKLHWDRPHGGNSAIIYCELKSSYNISRSWEILPSSLYSMLQASMLLLPPGWRQSVSLLSLCILHLTVPRERRGEGSYEKCFLPLEIFFISECL